MPYSRARYPLPLAGGRRDGPVVRRSPIGTYRPASAWYGWCVIQWRAISQPAASIATAAGFLAIAMPTP
ncbi:hypothetical protein VSX61_07040 [Brenneria populi subsp. brevivirga]|uniref:hypothetical protein n=1 Tax=Brenneria populi TaxID=1505588 RepID=UPI002E18A9F7|nr:hypothetical protein [Brenneria populi subsp. brevivirga]